MNVTNFRKDMFNCLNSVKNGVPLDITNKNDSYVLMTAADYSALLETIYLMSDPVTRDGLLRKSKDEEWFTEKDLSWNNGR